MFAGVNDLIVSLKDVDLIYEQIRPSVIYYEKLEDTDHGSFNLGKDMSYLNTVLELMDRENGFGKECEEVFKNNKFGKYDYENYECSPY